MRILLAEDDHQLRTSLTRGLREASCAVDQIAAGPPAQALALANDYDAIILDVLLPGRSGVLVCRGIREVALFTTLRGTGFLLDAPTAPAARRPGQRRGADRRG